MQTANLDLCKELYGLSGWDDTYHRWSKDIYSHDVVIDTLAAGTTVPAYNLGYLLRKLPTCWCIGDRYDDERFLYLQINPQDGQWKIGFAGYPEDMSAKSFASTPEDAACKLAIELFKCGVLIK